VSDFRFPWETAPATPAVAAPPSARTAKPRRGRPPGLGRAAEIPARRAADATTPRLAADASPGEGAVPPTAWLACQLSVTGPAACVDTLTQAAAGAGMTPWQRDFASEEEDLFHRLAARYPQTGRLSLDACRLFAAQFRERLQDHHQRAFAAIGQSRACPFDLHALLPVPEPLLVLGADHPACRRWLALHWGTTEIRHARIVPTAARHRRQPAGQTLCRWQFFAADTAPRAAIRRLAKTWPDLRLDLRPAGGAG
jgi:hypothetical protein